MRWVAGILLLAGAVLAKEDLDGKITGGKAKRYVDEAMPLLLEADQIYEAWVLDKLEGDALTAALKKAIRLYDEATAKLQKALDIRYDPGVNHRLSFTARRLQKMRFQVHFKSRKPAPARKPEEKPAEKPARKPEPAPPPEPPREPEPPHFGVATPPALPVDSDLPAYAAPEGDPEYEKLVKADQRAIGAMLKDYFQARRPQKLLFRHRLCQGKGTFRDGSRCEECGGTGKQINLFFFRRAFWGSFSPLLRDAPGALDGLKSFHGKAQSDLSALGPLTKSFKVREIEYHGYWARVRLEENTTEGKKERTYALISVGSSWYFYTPQTDGELIPRGKLG
ncbi:MAG: hypothetical protein ACYTGV_02515 [Planctomycetota bacterium]|jgi:hypothetical protein